MRQPFSFLAKALALTLLIAAAAISAWLYIEITIPFPRDFSGEVFVKIPRGTHSGRIADLLAESGIIRHRLPLIVYLRLTENTGRIKAGEYRFTEPASPKQITDRLVRGDVFFLAVTVPEGLTAMETVDLLSKKGIGDLESLQKSLQKTEWITDLDSSARNLEGYLFPETYHFDRKAGADIILRTMVDQFRKQFQKVLSANPLQAGWNASRIVILASMIEKEVQRAEERSIVSSVFHNRLEKRMPLGCDATIIYALKLNRTWDGNIRKSDLSIDSPYNTYKKVGLPPGPIANPGAASLQAALSPSDTEYLYYVSRNDGTHVFSKNYRDHQRAVNQYQR